MPMFPDRESKVPKFNYPDSFSDQISSLEKDHLIQRLSQSRSTYKDDPHRPIFHYVNPVLKIYVHPLQNILDNQC